MAGEPVIEVILDRGLDQLGRRHADQLLLRLPLELRVADEQRQHGAGAAADVVGVHRAGLAVADQLGVGLDAAKQAAAQAGLVEIGRAHVRTPVTNAQLTSRLLLDKKTNLKKTSSS